MKKIKERIDEKMKKNKGFTLIELLAVIVILAIIALIAVPTVMNIINKANKSAFKDSAYGIIKAGELFYTDQLLENSGKAEEKTFTFPNDIEGLELKGSKPTGGNLIVNNKGQVSMAITNGKYCITKGFNDEDVTIKEDDGTCVSESYNLGDVVYYNPNEAKVCTEAEWNNNADKNGKTGCMRWYVYTLNGSKPKLILDHNTTNMVEWISDEDYVDNEECGMEEGWVATCNDQGPVTLMRQLEEDTKNWKVTADIITLEEVMNLIPYYQNLSDTEKDLFLNPTEENKSVINGYYDYFNAFFGEVCSKPENLAICESGDFNAQAELFASQSNSPMLPAYMFMDMIPACPTGVGCPTYGYWTKTANAFISSGAWDVGVSGRVDTSDVNSGRGWPSPSYNLV